MSLIGTFGVGIRPLQVVAYIGAGGLMLGGGLGLLTTKTVASVGLNPLFFYGCGQCLWWSTTAGRALLLMEDAHLLRIPQLIFAVLISLLMHFLVLALIPAAILSEQRAAGFSALLAFNTLIVLSMFLSQLLPSTWSMASGAAGLLPFVMYLLAGRGLMPGVRDAGFALLGWGVIALLALVFAWRLRALFQAGSDNSTDGNRLVLQRFRRQLLSGSGGANLTSLDLSSLGVAKYAQLDSAGPDEPVRALQAWLGSPFTPVPAWMQFRRYALPLLLMVAAAALAVAMGIINSMALVIVIFGQNAYLVVRNIFLPRLQAVFAGKDSDVELLALLPGLGNGQRAKRIALNAIYRPWLIACAVQFLIIFVAIVALRTEIGQQMRVPGEVLNLSSVAIMLLLTDLVAGTLMLNAIVGRITSLWIDLLMLLPAMFISILWAHFPFSTIANNVLGMLLLLAFVVPLAWLLVPAWRRFQSRPHPFLLHR